MMILDSGLLFWATLYIIFRFDQEAMSSLSFEGKLICDEFANDI